MKNQAQATKGQAKAVSVILALVTLAVTARLTGYNGVAYIAAALEGYAVLCIAVCGAVPGVLGRILRIRGGKGQYRNAAAMRRNVLFFQTGFGLLGMAVLLFCAEEIAAKLFRTQYSSAILMIIAPAVLLRTFSSLLAGYAKGEGAELPAAAADILRQIFILAFSLLFSRMLGNYGEKVSRLLSQENFAAMYGGIGVAIAVTLTEAFMILFLLPAYKWSRRKGGRAGQDGMRATESFLDSVRIFCGSRFPQAAMLLLAVLWLPLGMILWQKASADSQTGVAEYGVYAAGFCSICGIAVGVVMLFLLPMCVYALNLLRSEEVRYARNVFQSGVHVCVAHGTFYAVFAAVMSDQIAAVPGGEQAALLSRLLRGGSSIVLLAALSLYFARLLILTGKKALVTGAVALADLIWGGAAAALSGGGRAGILSLVYAGLAAGGVLCAVLGTFAYRVFRQKMDWLHALAVPAVAAGVMGFLGVMLGKALTPHLGGAVTALVSLAVCGAVYWTILLLLRNFKEQELETIPGGKILYAMGQLLRVY